MRRDKVGTAGEVRLGGARWGVFLAWIGRQGLASRVMVWMGKAWQARLVAVSRGMFGHGMAGGVWRELARQVVAR